MVQLLPLLMGAAAASPEASIVLPGDLRLAQRDNPSDATILTLQATRLGEPVRRQLENVAGEASGFRVLTPSGEAGEASGFRVLTPSGEQGCGTDGCTVSGEYIHAEARFGVPAYGGDKMIVGELHYVTPEPANNGCDEGYDVSYVNKESGDVIYLVDRGECHFVDKVRIGELKGAAAVVIADNNCMCMDQGAGVHTAKFQEVCDAAVAAVVPPSCWSALPFMADDGSGGDINIPSFLITLWEAQRLKDCYNTAGGRIADGESVTGVVCKPDQPITVQLQWDMPNPDGNVEYDLWTNSDDSNSFKASFATSAQFLAPYTTFSPHYLIWDGERWGCANDNQMCGAQCTHAGRYCHADQDGVVDAGERGRRLAKGVSGADFMNENLRQLCVWKQAVETVKTDGGRMWWDYVNAFAKQCHGEKIADPSTFTSACSKTIHQQVGLSWEATMACIEEADLPAGCDPATTCKENTLLQAELDARAEKGIQIVPTVVVNNVIERGGVTPVAVLSTVCSGFRPGSEPDLCSCFETHSSNEEDVLLCASSQQCPTTEMPFYCTNNSKCTADEQACSFADLPPAPTPPPPAPTAPDPETLCGGSSSKALAWCLLLESVLLVLLGIRELVRIRKHQRESRESGSEMLESGSEMIESFGRLEAT